MKLPPGYGWYSEAGYVSSTQPEHYQCETQATILNGWSMTSKSIDIIQHRVGNPARKYIPSINVCKWRKLYHCMARWTQDWVSMYATGLYMPVNTCAYMTYDTVKTLSLTHGPVAETSWGLIQQHFLWLYAFTLDLPFMKTEQYLQILWPTPSSVGRSISNEYRVMHKL